MPRGTFAVDLARALELSEEADAPNTRRAYTADLKDWKAYADANDLVDFPIGPEALAGYLGSMQARRLKYATIRRRCSALSRLHKDAGKPNPLEDPRIRNLLKSLGRKLGRKKTQKKAVTADIVRQVIDDKGSTPMERALVSVGFVTGMRRSELTAIEWDDVIEHPLGLVIELRRSKTDQEGEGQTKGIPFALGSKRRCAATLLLVWKKTADTRTEPRVFPIDGKTVSRLVKRAAAAVGEDPRLYGAHSLRAGLATTAAAAGVQLATSMEATGHKSADVASGYVRSASALQNAAHKAAVAALGGGRR